MTCDNRNNPFAPIHVSDDALRPIGSKTCLKCGGEHKRFRLMNAETGPIYVESCPKDGLFDIGIVEVLPLKEPSALTFFADFKLEPK